MTNKKYTIKYAKPKCGLEYSPAYNTHTNQNDLKLTNTHPLIKTSIRKAINAQALLVITTCLTFSLVVSGIGYAQALNRTVDEVSSSDTDINTSPHYIAIENFQTQKENYWDLNNLENISPDRIFYVDMNKLVTIEDEESVFNFSDVSIQYSQNSSTSESSNTESSSLEQSKTDSNLELNKTNSSLELNKTNSSLELNKTNSSLKQVESKTSTYRYAYLIHLTDSERHVVESIVAGESGNQPFVGKKLVAQAIYNAMLRDNMSPSQVRKQYSYSGYKDIDEFEKECLKAYGNTNATDECRQAVKEIFDDCNMPTDDFVLFFYAPAYSKGTWHENAKTLKPITYIAEDGSTTNYIGGHKFFALKDEPVINYTREN